MALPAFTKITEHGRSPTDNHAAFVVSFAGDASYPTGGYADFTTQLQTLIESPQNPYSAFGFGDNGVAGYAVEYDETNDKLKVRAVATGLEAAAATDLSGVTFAVTVFCK